MLGRWVVLVRDPAAFWAGHRAFKVRRKGPHPALGLEEEAGTQTELFMAEVNAVRKVSLEIETGD